MPAQNDWKVGIRKKLKNFLRFPERIGGKYGRSASGSGGFAKIDDGVSDRFDGWKDVFREPKGGFHDQGARRADLARFRGQSPANFEISCVKERVVGVFQKNHCGSENMPGGKQGDPDIGIPREVREFP
jgi:hypothetical protein